MDITFLIKLRYRFGKSKSSVRGMVFTVFEFFWLTKRLAEKFKCTSRKRDLSYLQIRPN